MRLATAFMFAALCLTGAQLFGQDAAVAAQGGPQGSTSQKIAAPVIAPTIGTLADLGRLVQKAYPGTYGDMDPAEVGRRMQQKYPGAFDVFRDSATPASSGSHALDGVTASGIQWTDYQSGNYTFTVFNARTDDIHNVLCRVLFYDSAGNPLDTDTVRYPGTVPAGLAKRLTSNVDSSVHRYTSAPNRVGLFTPTNGYQLAPSTRIEVRIIDFEIAG